MKKLALAAAMLVAAGFGSACRTTLAKTPAVRPPLEVPPVPPRVIEPILPPPAPPVEPVGDLPAAPATPPRPRPNTSREPSKETKAEPKPPETPPAAEAAAPTTGAPQQATVPPLRTSRTADGVQAERQVRDMIGRANGLLGRVNYQKLTAERQKAYEQAKQFIEGAEAAIKDAKFEYALFLADKAETLAKELQG